MNTTKLVKRTVDFEIFDNSINNMFKNKDTKIYEENLGIILNLFFENENNKEDDLLEVTMVEHYMMVMGILDLMLKLSEEQENYERCIKIVAIAKEEYRLNLLWLNEIDDEEIRNDEEFEINIVNEELKYLKLKKPNRNKNKKTND